MPGLLINMAIYQQYPVFSMGIHCSILDTYLRYSDGGTSFLNKETMTIVEVRLSRIELRKKVTKPTCINHQTLQFTVK